MEEDGAWKFTGGGGVGRPGVPGSPSEPDEEATMRPCSKTDSGVQGAWVLVWAAAWKVLVRFLGGRF